MTAIPVIRLRLHCNLRSIALMQQNETTIIRFPELKKKLGNISRSTIDRWEKAGYFPSRILLGANSIGWRLDLVNQWLEGRSNTKQE